MSEVIEREAPRSPADERRKAMSERNKPMGRGDNRIAEEQKPAGLETVGSTHRGSREQRDPHAGGDLPMGVKDLPVPSRS
jgi:hypothetical protein